MSYEMKDTLNKHTKFGGIVKSDVDPSINTFSSLINLRNDLRLGGLVNRQGIDDAKDDSDVILAPPFETLDGFIYNDFGDIRSRIFLGNTYNADPFLGLSGLWSNPGYRNDNQVDEFVELTYSATSYVISVSTNTLTVPELSLLGDDLAENALYMIVRNLSTGKHEFAVVKSVGTPSGGNVVLTMSRDVSTWTAFQPLCFYKTELQASTDDLTWATGYKLPYTVTTRPQFINVGGKNDLGLVGVHEDLFGNPMWIGRITDRNYFGTGLNSFTYNGIYTTALMDDFTYGAFNKTVQHIQVKAATAPTVQQRLDPNADLDASGWTSTGANAFSVLADGDTPNDATFVNKSGTSARLHVAFGAITSIPPTDGNLQIKMRCATDAAQAARCRLHFYSGTTELVASNGSSWYTSPDQTFGGVTYTELTWIVPVKGFKIFSSPIGGTIYRPDLDLYNLSIRVDFNSTTATANFKVGYWEVYCPVSSYVPIAVGSGSDFTFSFSEVLDDFNETKLIYTKAYGKAEVSPASYVNANIVSINAGSSQTITLKISTKHGELINRRGTALRLYAAKTLTGANQIAEQELVWRYCRDIPFDSKDWTYSGGVYSVEVVIGDEINSGKLYVDRTFQSSNDDLLKDVYYATNNQSRTFARDAENKQVVFFSPINDNGFSQSALPSSNYFILSKVQGDIVGLSTINNKLLAWKKFSTWTIDVSGLPQAVVDNYVSLEVGLASLASIASGQRATYFVSYDGIYATDGFKLFLLNQSWIEEFRSYSQSVIEASVGFYDSYSDSYYIYINDILWVLDSKTGDWRQEDFSHTESSISRGLVGYNCNDFNGRTIFAGADTDDNLLYQFPRDDGLYTDTANAIDFNVDCSFTTNKYRGEIGLDEFAHVNNGYILSEDENNTLSGISLTMKDGNDTFIKTVTATSDTNLLPINSRTPLTEYSIIGGLTAAGKVTILEFGFYMKSMRRIGSTKTTLV